MANLKEIRVRIASVKSTQQITSAMKMVAASKLRKAQSRILTLRPYAQKQLQLLQELSAGSSDEPLDTDFNTDRGDKNILIVTFSSNRGLSGAYNSNVIKQTNQLIAKYSDQAIKGNVALITVGRKVSEFFSRKTNLPVLGSYDQLYDNMSYDEVSLLAGELIALYNQRKYDKIFLVYHQFKNAVIQYIQVEQFLPIVPAKPTSTAKKSAIEFIYDPSRKEILENLIPQILKTQLYKVLSDSWASEQGARMTAMAQATDNAADLIKDLKLVYNKARQSAITKEILEIVSGAEALKNS